MKIKAFFFKILKYLTLKIIFLVILVVHIILFFIINMYIFSLFPNFYDIIFKLMEHGVIEIWPILVDVEKYIMKISGDSFMVVVVAIFPLIYIFFGIHLLFTYMIDWCIFVLYYWGYLCYKVLNVFFFWLPFFHIRIFNLHLALYVLIFSTLYLLVAIYLLSSDWDFTIDTRTVLKYIVIWSVILMAISLWILVIITQIVSIQDITLWKGLQTLLYFFMINKLVVKIIKTKTKSIKKTQV